MRRLAAWRGPKRTEPRPPAEAVMEMRRCAGMQFDAAVVEALARVVEEDEEAGLRLAA
jgi:HD-GYP domain-containing protein (c-di-GMP phosphodiesterase class II)